jgi:AcrR family transcriptional regulator
VTSRNPERATAAKRRGRAVAARDDATRLGRDDWLDAAHDAVVAGGFDSVRVLSLADALGISRGSFYWHFADHAELVAALIARWRERELEADRALEARASEDPVEDLLRLLDAALARGGRDLEAMRFELALRGLGRRDPAVARMLAEVDGVRMAVLTAKFERLTGDAGEARDLAALLYVAVAGAHQALARPGSGPRLAAYLRETIAEHLIRRRGRGAVRRGRRAHVS